MAKEEKKAAPKAGVAAPSLDSIFKTLIKQHNDISEGIATNGTNMESEVKYHIDSGSLLLNMILANRPDGGWPSGRIVEVFGKESIGKSTLGYVALANCQKMGGIAIYADIERAGNKKFMKMLGINLDELIITNENVIERLFAGIEENLKFIINNNVRRDKPMVIVVDSVTALETEAEFEAGYGFNMNIQMKKAMMLGKALKKINPYLNKANACLYLVNQIRDNTSGYGESYVVPGGKSIPFYASIRLYLQGKSKLVVKDPVVENQFQEAMANWKNNGKIGEKPARGKADEVTIGYEVTAYTKKNKTSPPDRTAHFRIIFNKGLFDIECYLDYAIKFGIIKMSGAWCEFVHPSINKLPKFYATSWIELLNANPDVFETLETLLIDKLTIPIDEDFKEYSVDSVEGSDKDEYGVSLDVAPSLFVKATELAEAEA